MVKDGTYLRTRPLYEISLVIETTLVRNDKEKRGVHTKPRLYFSGRVPSSRGFNSLSVSSIVTGETKNQCQVEMCSASQSRTRTMETFPEVIRRVSEVVSYGC